MFQSCKIVLVNEEVCSLKHLEAVLMYSYSAAQNVWDTLVSHVTGIDAGVHLVFLRGANR